MCGLDSIYPLTVATKMSCGNIIPCEIIHEDSSSLFVVCESILVLYHGMVFLFEFYTDEMDQNATGIMIEIFISFLPSDCNENLVFLYIFDSEKKL